MSNSEDRRRSLIAVGGLLIGYMASGTAAGQDTDDGTTEPPDDGTTEPPTDPEPRTITFQITSTSQTQVEYTGHVASEPSLVENTSNSRMSAESPDDSTRHRPDGTWDFSGSIGSADGTTVYGDTFEWVTDRQDDGLLGWKTNLSPAAYEIEINGEAVDPSNFPEYVSPDWQGEGPQGVGVPSHVNVGGGSGYDDTFGPSDATAVARTGSELYDALTSATSDDVVFLDGSATVSTQIPVRSGVTLASGRGNPNATTGTIHASGAPNYGVLDVESGARVSGVRFDGGVSSWIPWDGSPSTLSSAIDARGVSNVEIDNCEISNFGWAGVHANGDVHVHHCHIHDILQDGYAYGVINYGGTQMIEANRFERMRHCVNGSGNGSYTARFNVVEEEMFDHCFDQHSGGTRTEVYRNTIKPVFDIEPGGGARVPAVTIRGVPSDVAQVYENWIWNNDPPQSYGGAINDEWRRPAINQKEHGSSGFVNVEFWGNVFGR